MKCPNCCGEIQLDDSKDFGFCMYCGTKVQVSQRIKVEHTGSIAVDGLATIENLIKAGFLNVENGDASHAEDNFQKVLSLDANNIHAFIGLMCLYPRKNTYYQYIARHSTSFSQEEALHLNQSTCRLFAEAYACSRDYDRLDFVLANYPRENECNWLVRCDRNTNIKKVKIFVKHGMKPCDIFWECDVHYLDRDALEYLLSAGLDPNEKKSYKYRYTEGLVANLYKTPLGSVITANRLDLAESLLQHGADPNGSTFIWKDYSPVEERYISVAESESAKALLKEYGAKSGACYIATAIYGTYDCPQVWVLRRFRDNVLARTWYGRLFVRAYYTVSPAFVRWFSHTHWFKSFWKGFLDKMVNNLEVSGVEATPYQDTEW